MGQKVHPLAFRIGVLANWKSRWFNKKQYSEMLKQDIKLRDFIMKKLDKAGLNRIEIERLANSVKIIIHTARPGLVIGRGGSGIEDLKKEMRNAAEKNIKVGLILGKIATEEGIDPTAKDGAHKVMEKLVEYARN